MSVQYELRSRGPSPSVFEVLCRAFKLQPCAHQHLSQCSHTTCPHQGDVLCKDQSVYSLNMMFSHELLRLPISGHSAEQLRLAICL